jgi:hypothetical protein
MPSDLSTVTLPDGMYVNENGQVYYDFCGKFVENDSTISIKPGTSTGDSSGTGGSSGTGKDDTDTTSPDDGSDTGTSDNSTDIVHWLKKIYNRLGVILGLMILEDVVDFTKDFVNNTADEVLTVTKAVTAEAENKFPFCMIYVFRDVFEVLAAEPETPVFPLEFNIPSTKYGDLDIKGFKYALDIDFSTWDETVAMIRNLEVLLFLVALGGYTFKIVIMLKGSFVE